MGHTLCQCAVRPSLALAHRVINTMRVSPTATRRVSAGTPRRQRIATCAPRSHGDIRIAAVGAGGCSIKAATAAVGLVHATMWYSAPGVGACTMAVRLAPLGAWRTAGTSLASKVRTSAVRLPLLL